MRKVRLVLLVGCMLTGVKGSLMQHVDDGDQVGFHARS